MGSKAPVLNELPVDVAERLVGGQAHIVSTIDPDGRPSTTLMTWVVARDSRTLALCVDTRSRAYQNLVERPAVAIEILADGITYGVKGTARVVKAQMHTPPFPCALVQVAIDEARDHGHAGTYFKGPSYIFDDAKAHRLDFERRVIAELCEG